MNIVVNLNGKREKYDFDDQKSILKNLRKYNYSIKSPCAGRGICNQCMIGIQVGMNQIRMKACQLKPKESMEIVLLKDYLEEDIYIPHQKNMVLKGQSKNIIIDIGTTTIVLAVYDIKLHQITYLTSCNNPQRAWGADVLSRLSAAEDVGVFKQMSLKTREQIKHLLDLVKAESSSKIIVSANTCMTHLFYEYPVDGLGRYPFIPYETSPKPYHLDGYILEFIPGLTAFVGGDIVSGILDCNLLDEPNSLLVDIGTNAEMVLSSKGSIYIASAAAGPAFEGVGIRFGMAAVAGAISSVQYQSGAFQVETIGDQKPKGICGSGLISLLSVLIENGFLNESGSLLCEKGKVYLSEDIYIDNEDISLLLLAKAAIYTGIQILLKKHSKVDRIYLSGGFSNSINVKDAIRIGMIPEIGLDKVNVLPNTSIGGGIKYLENPNLVRKRIYEIKERVVFVSLAEDESFQDLYIKNIGVRL